METGGPHNLFKIFPSVILDSWVLTRDFVERRMLRNESHFQRDTAQVRRPCLCMEKAQDRQSGQGSNLFKNVPVGEQEQDES